jgi:hypothetical protein
MVMRLLNCERFTPLERAGPEPNMVQGGALNSTINKE